MPTRLITAPAAEPITRAELKLQTRVQHSLEDGLLDAAIAGARSALEERIGRALITQTWETVLDAWPGTADAVELARPPVASITSVQYVPAGGSALVTLDPGAYVLDNVSDSYAGWLLPAPGTTWPALADGVANAVRVRYVCGYGADGSAVPAALRSWLLLTAAYLYANREAVDSTGRAVALPGRFVDGLLDPYVRYSA